jgi:hypothetical protein
MIKRPVVFNPQWTCHRPVLSHRSRIQAQVHTDGREAECERTVNRKIKDLWNLI